jgi:hypothetical protein
MPKLEIQLEQVRLGKIHVLCICEAKLSNKHLEALTSLIKHNKLAHRMTYTDQTSLDQGGTYSVERCRLPLPSEEDAD